MVLFADLARTVQLREHKDVLGIGNVVQVGAAGVDVAGHQLGAADALGEIATVLLTDVDPRATRTINSDSALLGFDVLFENVHFVSPCLGSSCFLAIFLAHVSLLP